MLFVIDLYTKVIKKVIPPNYLLFILVRVINRAIVNKVLPFLLGHIKKRITLAEIINNKPMKIPTIMKAFKLPVELYKAIEKARGSKTFHGYIVTLLKSIHKVK